MDYPVLLYALRRDRLEPVQTTPRNPTISPTTAHLLLASVSTNSVQAGLQFVLWLVRESQASSIAYAVALAYQVRIVPMLAATTMNQFIVRQPDWVLSLSARFGALRLLLLVVLCMGVLSAALGVVVHIFLDVGAALDDYAFFLVLFSSGVVVGVSAVNALLYAVAKLVKSAAFALSTGVLMTLPFLTSALTFQAQWLLSVGLCLLALLFAAYRVASPGAANYCSRT
jgi:hypothetical protein